MNVQRCRTMQKKKREPISCVLDSSIESLVAHHVFDSHEIHLASATVKDVDLAVHDFGGTTMCYSTIPSSSFWLLRDETFGKRFRSSSKAGISILPPDVVIPKASSRKDLKSTFDRALHRL